MENCIAQPDTGVATAANGSPEVQTDSDRTFAEFEAKWEAKGARIATENGFATFKEYENAQAPIRRAKWLADAHEEKQVPGLDPRKQFMSLNPETRRLGYNPEKCLCTEHMVDDFCPGNLASPPRSVAGSDGNGSQAQLPRLGRIFIAVNEPSKRLPDSEVFRLALLESDSDFYPNELDPCFRNDDVTNALRYQKRLEKGRRSLLGSEIVFANVEMQSTSHSGFTSSAPRDNDKIKGAERTGHNDRGEPNGGSGTDLLSDVADDVGPQPKTSTAHGKKRSLVTLDEQQDKEKQRKIGSGAAVVSSPTGSRISPPTASDQSKQDTLEVPEAAQDKNEPKRVDSTLGVTSPRNTTGSVPATSVSQGQKRIRDEPRGEQVPGPLNKKIRLISDVEKATQTNILHDHRRRHEDRSRLHPSAELFRTFPQRSSLNGRQAEVAPTSVGSGESSQRSPERQVQQPTMPEHSLPTAGRHEIGREQESRQDRQQEDNPDAPAIVGIPQSTPQATPTTPTRGMNTENMDAADDERHKKSKASIWEDLSNVRMQVGDGELGRHLGATHPRSHERAQPSASHEEIEVSDSQRSVAQVLQSSPPSDPTTPSRTTKRKTVHEPGETSPKRIRLSTEKDLTEARQLEREAEHLDRRVEVARRRQQERTLRSPGHRMVRGQEVQVVNEVPQSKPQVLPTTSPDNPPLDVQEESQTQAKQRGRGSTKRGARKGKTVPASAVGAARRTSAVKKSKATDRKGPAPPTMSAFLEQPRRTRSKNNQIFYELGEQGRGLTHKLKRSQRTGRSW
ncbi:MAG: hypothetical protein Q9207_003079 [Kuettlingeria erythrocarpa]